MNSKLGQYPVKLNIAEGAASEKERNAHEDDSDNVKIIKQMS